MRIAVFAKRTTLHKGYGGMETMNRLLCEGLVERGHEVSVFSPCWEREPGLIEENKIEYHFIDCVYRMGPLFGFFGSSQKSNWINRSVSEFSKLHKENKFDIVLGHSSSALGIIRNKRDLNVRVISISHGSIIGEYQTFVRSMRLPRDLVRFVKITGFTLRNFFWRQRAYIHGSNRVVTVSTQVKNALIDETFAPEEKFYVIHNCIDDSLYKDIPLNISRGTKMVYVGQVVSSKGVDSFVKLLLDEKLIGYSLDVVGSGDRLDYLKKESHRLGLDSRITFLGKFSYDDLIAKVYKNIEYGLFVFPTKRVEGLPMVLVESLHAGIPVVATNLGGNSDVVFDGETGYLIEENDRGKFIDLSAKILSDDDLRVKLSRNSLEKARGYFTLSNMLDEYEKVIQSVLV